MKSKRNSKIKAVALGVATIATSFVMGMSAGCAKTNPNTNTEDEKVTTKEDLQDIKNGNFEFYNDNDGLYPISTPDSWDFSYKGTNSTSMSGVIDTSKEGWDYLTDPELPKILEDNDDLDSDDDNKKDYNGALTEDMLYKDTHKATEKGATDEDKQYIDNPYTRNLRWDEEAEKYVYINDEGVESDVYTDEDGKLYSDEELKNEIGTSVLMIHNYYEDNNYGTEGYYESSTTLSLEANTACKISLWVKTAELYSGDSAGKRSEVTFDKGAYIKVNTEVGGNSLDSFVIKNINTEQLNKDATTVLNNGWVQYTVYVEASSFASTTVNLTLGLGENGNHKTIEGYAFFDDITFERYINLDALKDANSDFDSQIRTSSTPNLPANTSYPLSANAVNEFRVDVTKNTTNNEGNGGLVETITNKNNSEDRVFFIDFASTTPDNLFELTASNTLGGFTVDDDNYLSSKGTFTTNGVGALHQSLDSYKLPKNLKDGLNVENDFISIESITPENWSLSLSSNPYASILTESLKSAVNLPGVSGNANTLVMLSSWGAGYEAQISDNSLKLANGESKLISFWVKTSDFNGKTATTVTVTDTADDTNTENFTIDSTTHTTTDFGDEKDIYDGWVRCFIRVNNASEEEGDKSFNIKINLGKTSFKGTTATDYYNQAGWIAITNLTIMDLDEDVFGYTSGLSNTASLTFEEKTPSYSEGFDTEQGDKNEIETDLAIPYNYSGVNGASVNVAPTGSYKGDYDATNSNDFAGLLNKNNLENYSDKDWYSKVVNILGLTTPTYDELWNKLAGEYTVQPLLIVNTVRTFNEASKIYNYGYINTDPITISSDSYKQVSVRVKASAGAIAYVYLVDTDSADNSVLTYKLPEYNFYYDDEGNLLKTAYDEDATKAEKAENIAYTLRDDGLYEKDGKLYANFYNLTKYYDYKYQGETFYDENGNTVKFKNLVTGNTYYADASLTKYASHYLIAGGKENNKIYEYVSGIGDNATYYYVENGVANTAKLVNGVDKSLARYVAQSATPYSFVVDTVANPEYADKWVTVTFYICTGSESKNYRLELWSGARDEESSYSTNDESYVLFDYNAEDQTALDETTFSEKLNYYTDAIIADLKENIPDGTEIADNDLNIAELEELVGDGYNKIYDYASTYYTFSLYDSPDFIPFNLNTAEDGETGYSYAYSDYEEALAFLKVCDTTDDNYLRMSAFVDYSVVDKDIEIIGEPTVPDIDDDTNSTTTTSDTNVWLLVASIVLTVAIFVAILAMGIKALVSKLAKRKLYVGKNTYNFNKNKRYVRKYVKANGETPEVTDNVEGDVKVEDEVSNEATVEEQPTEEQTETTEETTATEENGEGEDKKPE
ncbi:MAG: hypothetical protein ACI4MS_03110 [Candidatus Coproplasma sp.]